MEPVVNPWIFYWIDVLNNLNNFLFILICLAGAYVLYHWYVLSIIYEDIPVNKIPKKKIVFGLLPLPVILFLSLILVFTPSKNTCYKMLTASNITHERVADVKDVVNKVYNDLIKLGERVVK